MTRSADPIAALRGVFLRRMGRFGRHAVRTILVPSPAFSAADARLPELVARHRETILRWLDSQLADGPAASDGIIETLVEGMSRYLLDHNPYLMVDGPLRGRLRAVYTASTADFRDAVRDARGRGAFAARLPVLFASHQKRLAAFIREVAAAHADAGPEFVFREPVRSEYAPELQLRVLGIAPADLVEPVLDLGCGRSAALVRRLHDAGVDAWGIDRAVRSGPRLLRADWLSAPLGRARWGTILSHLAFSLHFLHQHLRPRGAAERYARRYVEVLQALRPGGSFRYAPALPFLEPLLGRDRFRVSTTALPPGLASPEGADADLPAGTWRATCVVRLPGPERPPS